MGNLLVHNYVLKDNAFFVQNIDKENISSDNDLNLVFLNFNKTGDIFSHNDTDLGDNFIIDISKDGSIISIEVIEISSNVTIDSIVSFCKSLKKVYNVDENIIREIKNVLTEVFVN